MSMSMLEASQRISIEIPNSNQDEGDGTLPQLGGEMDDRRLTSFPETQNGKDSGSGGDDDGEGDDDGDDDGECGGEDENGQTLNAAGALTVKAEGPGGSSSMPGSAGQKRKRNLPGTPGDSSFFCSHIICLFLYLFSGARFVHPSFPLFAAILQTPIQRSSLCLPAPCWQLTASSARFATRASNVTRTCSCTGVATISHGSFARGRARK